MNSPDIDTATRKIFDRLLKHPKAILLIGFLSIAIFASQIPKIEKDTRVDAFIPPDHPALQYRNKIKETFGLKDPMVIALVDDGPQGVFNIETLALVKRITHELQKINNIDPEKITSLATEKNIAGTNEGLYVQAFLETLPKDESSARALHQSVMNVPLYIGSLVAADGTATLIVFEMLNEKKADTTYEAVLDLLERSPVSTQRLYLAGEAAVGGYWSAVIDRDSRRLQPIAALVILFVLAIAFKTLRGVCLPLTVVLATAAGTMGLMAIFRVPFFAITNALPVLLIGIAVADSIHILSQYYEEEALDHNASSRELVLRTMARMWRPITLTTFTTAAGFMGLAISSIMPPMTYFGLFAIAGVTLALLYSLLVVPAILIILSPKSSPAFKNKVQGSHSTRQKFDIYARGMSLLGRNSARFALPVLVLGCCLALAGVYGALKLKTDRARIANINPHDPLYIANQEINKRFNGTSYLDIIIETTAKEGLYNPDNLTRIEALQNYLATLPHVGGSVSIVDYLKQLNQAMNADQTAYYKIPDNEDLVAQYLLLYTTTGDPTDFEEEVDYGYKTANLRVFMNSGFYSDSKPVMKAAQHYLDTVFNNREMSATLSGRVALDYYWIARLADSHFKGVALALILVCAIASLMFKSIGAGMLATLPVAFSVLLIYAVMGITGITLEPATSMFATIAIGLSVDFSIHTVERLIHLMKEQGRAVEQAIAQLFPSTGRSLFFNFATMFFGFSTLLTSELPTLQRFGGMISVAILSGFASSLILIPALVVIFKPKFLRPASYQQTDNKLLKKPTTFLLLSAIVCSGIVSEHLNASESPSPSGYEIAQSMNDRNDGTTLSQTMKMTLVNKSGAERIRTTKIFRQDFDNERRMTIFFESPKRLKGTAFLIWDTPQASDDTQWLYLPAARRVRRISASDRGDYFFGTDFTYEDVKKATKLELTDYTFETLGTEDIEGATAYLLNAIPKTAGIAQELGYSRILCRVRPDNWMPMQIDYWDIAGNPLKTVRIIDIRPHEGIWTPFQIEARNHKTGHSTIFNYSDISYRRKFDPSIFSKQGLQRGL